jgi:DNA replication protein DnaC
MLRQPTLEKLRQLKLTGMADAFSDQLSQPALDLDFESRLAFLVDREWHVRENRRLKRRLHEAKLQQIACVENIDFQHPRGLNKSIILELSQCQWISNHLSLMITGPTGCGKTFLACALSHKACLQGFTSRYYRLPRLWHELTVAKADGTYTKWLSQMSKINVLILDDWGIDKLNDERRRDLLEILDDRYDHASTIITSQLPVSHWHEYLDDATLADAILDRLLHQSVKLELKGESLRKTKKQIILPDGEKSIE